MTKAVLKAVLGIIGGSGIYDLSGLENAREEAISSPWGEPSAPVRHGFIAGLPIVFLPLGYERRTRLLTIWNVIGFVDILMVVLTAIRLNLADPTQLRAMLHLPLSLLPTFLVPLIIATHVIIFARIARAQRRS